MEIKVLEYEKNRLKFEMVGSTQTLAHLITKELWNDSDVTVSGYHLKHPQISHPTLLIETTKKDPKKVLLDALVQIKKKSGDFKTSLRKIVK